MDSESKINLATDEAAVREFLQEHRGELHDDEDGGGTYWAVMRPRSFPNETFYARIAWTSYPHQAPSVKFGDGIKGNLSTTGAWPIIAGYRPSNFDICKPFTAEAFALHPDWHTGPHAWRSAGNPFLWVIANLQDDLDQRYQGRSQ